ncbi:uncharacterized protein (DUF433 family) [Catenuloplanes atrovinosus]|uniref:Uncharacterized protein (DUF433 family) n=1 Tax=Catenuloplanes atrovinosus TaxID=137266 RepID=A0AAE3YUP2_9ACTN|nr:uncharacterized protein (DUF433 family) [Catenuloplanes atrovinosus]
MFAASKIRAETIAELSYEGGESIDDIADEYNLQHS